MTVLKKKGTRRRLNETGSGRGRQGGGGCRFQAQRDFMRVLPPAFVVRGVSLAWVIANVGHGWRSRDGTQKTVPGHLWDGAGVLASALAFGFSIHQK